MLDHTREPAKRIVGPDSKEVSVFFGYAISRAFRKATIWAFDKKTHRRICIDTCTPFPQYSVVKREAVIAEKLREYGIPYVQTI